MLQRLCAVAPRHRMVLVRKQSIPETLQAVLFLIGLLLTAGTATAATITVNSLADSTTAGDVQCTLREALANANSNSDTTGGDCVAGSGADTIVFQAALTGTITLGGTELPVSDSVTITGPAAPPAAGITISGNDLSRIFNVSSPNVTPIDVTISNLTLTHGRSSTGGAIVADKENLTLSHLAITGNAESGGLGGGGVFFNGTGAQLSITSSAIQNNTSDSGSGGGLNTSFVTSSINLADDTITGNQALIGGNGGGVSADLGIGASFIVRRSTISNNRASTNGGFGAGGGIYVSGTTSGTTPLLIEDTTIANNSVGGVGEPNRGTGGGLMLASVLGAVIHQSTVSSNGSGLDGAGIKIQSSGSAGAPVILENSTIANNSGTGNGGGLSVVSASYLNIAETTITGNNPSPGGGVFGSSSVVNATNSIIANNGLGDVSGTITATYTLIKNTTGATILGGTGNITGQDPQLGPLAVDPGSFTATEDPTAGSPVINTGDPAFTPPPVVDQAHQPRVSGGRIDMGAIEIQSVVVQVPVLDPRMLLILACTLAAVALAGRGRNA